MRITGCRRPTAPTLAESVIVDPTHGGLINLATNTPLPVYLASGPDMGSVDPRITNGIVQCGVNGVPDGCMKGHLVNPSPRVGFAWDPTGSGG